ncbi:hypothetical protein niasHS_006137 [Heterodera schachtii]|uniref:GOLD domain-containing protein n=1 Tax=Heterodera schachtii TaxID=97005 RepID=A0ABD2JW56_HETSC
MSVSLAFFLTLFLVLLLFSSFVTGGEYDLTAEVPPGKIQCFFQPVLEKHKSMEVYYQVIDGGDLNINFMLILDANVLKQDQMRTDGDHKIDIPAPADYQLCFDNSFSYQTRKVVFFEIYLYDANGTLEEEDVTKFALKGSDAAMQEMLKQVGMTIQQFQESFTTIKTRLDRVEYYQGQFRASEARDRAVVGANNDRVQFWSLVNTVVMLIVGGIQVWTIRSLFEENSKFGRLIRGGGGRSGGRP